MLLDHWSAIELDLQTAGIDVESGILAERTWRWLELRIIGCVTAGGHLTRVLQA
ncbi:hypothetical protein [Gordonia sp. NB41Y]|uniref:hypothetical protein n=1 Tax=Gordonia sp. NB41Y TaxID=875808 RepID=UPI0002BE7732|nr:hypothetical protein [Gordonia sp. NB41Y]WLP90259.1 hypothetical protein Q9K23_22540 [Gordonia sp. NB41Y]